MIHNSDSPVSYTELTMYFFFGFIRLADGASLLVVDCCCHKLTVHL